RARARRRHRAGERQRTPAHDLRRQRPARAHEHARPRHVRDHRNPGALHSRASHRVVELKAVLVDDEQLARDELGFLLSQTDGVEVIGQAGNGVEALETITRLEPDLVFLDVQMPGLTGFEVARRLLADAGGHPLPNVIFVTAYDEHAIEAFEVNAVDYL